MVHHPNTPMCLSKHHHRVGPIPCHSSIKANPLFSLQFSAISIFPFFPQIHSLCVSVSNSKELADLSGPTKGSSSLDEEIGDSEPVGEKNKWVVRALYEALNARDVETVHRLLAHDIEWWFHGPPSRQHMMRLLTGASPEDNFRFVPLSIESLGPTVVLVEGSDPARSVFWVHAWSVGPDGIITQVREYFNTSLTVTRLVTAASATTATKKKKPNQCVPVWQSRLHEDAGLSLPGLVLAL